MYAKIASNSFKYDKSNCLYKDAPVGQLKFGGKDMVDVNLAWLATGTGMLVTGIILVGACYGTKPGGKFNKKLAKLPGVIGIILLLLGVGSLVGINLVTAPPAEIISATYDITCHEHEAELTTNNDTNHINWAIQYNTTSNAFVGTTGAGTFNFSVSWSSGPAGPVSLMLGANPMVAITGSADVGVVDVNADDQQNAVWSKMNAADTIVLTGYYETCQLYVGVADSEWAEVVITLEASAFAAKTSANELESWTQYIIVGGESWEIDYVLYDVIT
jgi:hypothetical protein